MATGEAIRSTGEAFAPRVNMLDEALFQKVASPWLDTLRFISLYLLSLLVMNVRQTCISALSSTC